MNTRPWLQRLGPWTQAAEAWPWWAAGLAVLGALVLSAGLAPRWQQAAERQLSAVHGAGAAVQERLAFQPAFQPVSRPAVDSMPTQTPRLPPAAQAPDRVAAVTALARHHGLALLLVQEQNDAQGQMQLVLSGQGRYPELRAFVAGTLAADAAAVLERLRLQRADAATAELNFEMQWTLLHHVELPTAAAARPAGGRAAP